MSCAADQDLALLVATSSDIRLATMQYTRADLTAEAGRERPGYIEIPIVTHSVLKGGAADRDQLRYYPQEGPYGVGTERLSSTLGNQSLLFLIYIDSPAGLYFAGYTSSALQPASADAIATAVSEIERQDAIAENWRAEPSLPYFEQVGQLIAQLGVVEGQEQAQVFAELEALGPGAIPAIIHQMDNRSLLRTQGMMLRNLGPDAFEARRHYSLGQVVDALAAILNQLSSQSFGSIHNGASDAERTAAVSGWRVYAHDLQCGDMAAL